MFTSRLIEKAALSQIVSHLKNTGLYAKYNSTYRAHYTTKTFLTKIHSDIMNNFDKQNLTLLVMLDLSASFDTIDLNILINTIETRFSITESSLQWFSSYIMNNNQHILINNTLSNDTNLKWGVPQGSCAGPITFLLYSISVNYMTLLIEIYPSQKLMLMILNFTLNLNQKNQQLNIQLI